MSFLCSLSKEDTNDKEEMTFIPNQASDTLVEALGKLDCYDHVKAIGGINVGLKLTFTKMNRKVHKPRSTERLIMQDEL